MPRSRYHFVDQDAPYFLTMTVNNWLPVFTRLQTVEIVLDCWRYLQQNRDFRLYGYVILENHIHLTAQSPALGKDIQRFKSYTAKRILEHLKAGGAARLLELLALCKHPHKVQSQFQVWEEGSHPQRIDKEEVMRQKLDYIHYNPVKQGYVDLPEHWRYSNSSARNYAGQEGLIEVVRDW